MPAADAELAGRRSLPLLFFWSPCLAAHACVRPARRGPAALGHAQFSSPYPPTHPPTHPPHAHTTGKQPTTTTPSPPIHPTLLLLLPPSPTTPSPLTTHVGRPPFLGGPGHRYRLGLSHRRRRPGLPPCLVPAPHPGPIGRNQAPRRVQPGPQLRLLLQLRHLVHLRRGPSQSLRLLRGTSHPPEPSHIIHPPTHPPTHKTHNRTYPPSPSTSTSSSAPTRSPHPPPNASWTPCSTSPPSSS